MSKSVSINLIKNFNAVNTDINNLAVYLGF